MTTTNVETGKPALHCLHWVEAMQTQHQGTVQL